MIKTRILLIEDDEIAAELTLNFLKNCGFDAKVCFTATDAISNLMINKYDILLLDLNLPDFDGFDILKKIKNIISTPVIIISAYSQLDIKLKAFKLGASDYMIKPIEFEELEARIWIHTSKDSNITDDFQINIFTIDGNIILFNDKQLSLTSTEFDILSLFINNKNNLLSRKELCTNLSSVSSHRSLDNHILNIRKKIEIDAKNPQYLKTEYGLGYKLII